MSDLAGSIGDVQRRDDSANGEQRLLDEDEIRATRYQDADVHSAFDTGRDESARQRLGLPRQIAKADLLIAEYDRGFVGAFPCAVENMVRTISHAPAPQQRPS